jgi:para-aminobenzoate synthetase component 1
MSDNLIRSLKTFVLGLRNSFSANDLACQVHLRTSEGFEHVETIDFLTTTHLSDPLNLVVGKMNPRLEFRFFLLCENVKFTRSKRIFLQQLAECGEAPLLFVHPYVPASEDLASEDFCVSQWSHLVELTVEKEGDWQLQLHSTIPLPEHIQSAVENLRMDLQSRGVGWPPALCAQKEVKTLLAHRNKINPQSGSIEHLSSAIEQAQKKMQNGDCYVMNLSTRVSQHILPQDFDLIIFLDTWWNNPSRFGLFLKTSALALMSFSPERFAALTGQTVLTEPIKGTKKAEIGLIPTQSDATKLWNSEKEICELTMITDLLRHDLNSVCIPGSVQVFQPFFARIAGSLLQMQSTIFGTVPDDVTFSEVLLKMLPAGSITGAPKKIVCELIDELEEFNRGYFTGIAGWRTPSLDWDSIVLIRSHFMGTEKIPYTAAGAGITTQSIINQEIFEIFEKFSTFRLAH